MRKSTQEIVLEYLERNWTGKHGGPVKTLEVLLEHSGFFEVPHLLLAYIEFFGRMSSGKGHDANYSDMQDFFDRYFPEPYREASGWLIYIFRHGFAHHYAPKILNIDDLGVLGWQIFIYPSEEARKRHLNLNKVQHRNVLLEISGVQFFYDFRDAIDKLILDVKSNPDVLENFYTGYRNIGALHVLSEELKKNKLPYLIDQRCMEWMKSGFNKNEGTKP